MAGFALAFSAAAFGLPGLANFVGESYSLIGAFEQFPLLTMLAALGLIGSAIYGMHLFQSTFQGPATQEVMELTEREILICLTLLVGLLSLGLFPNLLLMWITGAAL